MQFLRPTHLTDGLRESSASWSALMLKLQRRGLKHAPELAIAGKLAQPA